MSVIGSNILAGASGQGAGGYNLTRSLRFRNSASAYLNRTPASAGNLRTWTWSAWVKRGELGNKNLFACTSTQHYIGFNGGNGFNFQYDAGGVNDYKIFTNQVFRDPSAWYHIVAVWDTTNATSSSRMRLYVNGEQITSLSASNYPPQNYDGSINSANPHTLGSYGTASYLDGYLTEVNFIDGQALTPSSFGETNSKTGVWQPKRYAGTYGTNGFYLPFTDNSALTTSSNAGLGKDFSGNGNYWTTNNISITSGATYDSMTDVPTLTSATASNFAVMNPLSKGTNVTIADGNLKCTYTSTSGITASSTMQIFSGMKTYFEVYTDTVGTSNRNIYIGAEDASTYAQYNGSNGQIYVNGALATTVATSVAGDTNGIAVDYNSGTVAFYKNGSLLYTATGVTTSQNWAVQLSNTTNGVFIANFGQRPFAYTPPTGYVALNTYNLPTPTIGATASSQANKYMDATLYTGTGSSNAVVNAGGFQPDLVWIKSRSNAYPHFLYDAVRGAGKYIASNNTDAETTTNQMTSFNSNGFTVNNDGGSVGTNNNGSTFVGWQWKGANTTVTNTAGSITSTVSANTTSGFSVVTWTGNATAGATIGHGLGVAPKMIFVKRRNSTENWAGYHASLGATKAIFLNLTIAALDDFIWDNTAPTSSVFSVGGGVIVNGSGSTYVGYCFSEVAGFSKFGSYTGNGSSDGTFVYTGFRPKYIMIRNSSITQNWNIYDVSRSPYNVAQSTLSANTSGAEFTDPVVNIDILSNGFKARTTDSGLNGNGNTIIYAAFAEFPTKYSLAR